MKDFAKRILEAELPTNLDRILWRQKYLYHLVIFTVLAGAALFGFESFLYADRDLLKNFWSQIGNNGWFQLYFALLACALIGRLVITILSYTWYKRTFGHAISPRYIVFMHSSFWLFQLTFALCVAGFGYLVVQVGELVSGLTGYDSDWSLERLPGAFDHIVAAVPVIIELPYLFAFMLVYLSASFFSYWAHRLPHESRVLWLMAHRPHHTSTTLTDITVMEADPQFALGFLNKFAFAVLAGVSAKLFYPEPMVYEFVALGLVKNMTEVLNHSSVFYERVTKLWDRFPPLKWLCHFSGSGPYHYLHHSSREGEEVVNVGGDPFLIWDHLFGTFKDPPPEKPPIGLTNQPEIYINPVAHVFSGFLQIGYELVHNKSFRDRLQILFGSAYYTPPKSHDFLKKLPGKHPSAPSLPHIFNEVSET
ncbi:MAG: sterol desaturase family protein [Parasphingorhabdus sp.]